MPIANGLFQSIVWNDSFPFAWAGERKPQKMPPVFDSAQADRRTRACIRKVPFLSRRLVKFHAGDLTFLFMRIRFLSIRPLASPPCLSRVLLNHLFS